MQAPEPTGQQEDLLARWIDELADVGSPDADTKLARVAWATSNLDSVPVAVGNTAAISLVEYVTRLAVDEAMKQLRAERRTSRRPKTSPKPSRCTVCSLPPEIREQVEQGRRESTPVSYKLLSQWLRTDHGIEINFATINNHFRAFHHEKDEA